MTREISREEMLAMPAGREMDFLIRTKVFGYQLEGFEWAGDTSHSLTKVVGSVIVPHNVPEYSTDISAAMEVEAKIAEGDIWLKVGYVEHLRRVQGWDGNFIGSEIMFALIHATAEQRCKAALLATMEETP